MRRNVTILAEFSGTKFGFPVFSWSDCFGFLWRVPVFCVYTVVSVHLNICFLEISLEWACCCFLTYPLMFLRSYILVKHCVLTVTWWKTLRQSGLIHRMVTNGCSAVLSSVSCYIEEDTSWIDATKERQNNEKTGRLWAICIWVWWSFQSSVTVWIYPKLIVIDAC